MIGFRTSIAAAIASASAAAIASGAAIGLAVTNWPRLAVSVLALAVLLTVWTLSLHIREPRR